MHADNISFLTVNSVLMHADNISFLTVNRILIHDNNISFLNVLVCLILVVFHSKCWYSLETTQQQHLFLKNDVIANDVIFKNPIFLAKTRTFSKTPSF